MLSDLGPDMELAPSPVIEPVDLRHTSLGLFYRSAAAQDVKRPVSKSTHVAESIRSLPVPITSKIPTTNYPKS